MDLRTIFLIWLVFVLASVIVENFIAKRLGEFESLQAKTGRTVATYFIPGLNGPPSEVFGKYADVTPGDTWLFRYSHLGFDPELNGAQIAEHAKSHGYTDVNVYAISIGAKVARYIRFDNHDVNLHIWLICPASKPNYLWSNLHILLKVVSPIMMVLRLCLGVLSDIPILPIDGVWRSYADQAEQLFSLAYRKTHQPDNTVGIILCEDDQFLDNNVIALDNDNIKNVVVTDTSHADIGKADRFITYGTHLGAFSI